LNKYFIIPGLGNSGANHWQTYFENTELNFKRIMQSEWDSPLCGNWINKVDEEIIKHNLNECILIGHSLGCATIVHWAMKFERIIKGAMLVAPSDLESDTYKFPAKGFSPIPREKLNFQTIIVASENDKWVSIERAKYFAECWGSEIINIGNAGHINAESGFGRWPEGLEILKRIN